MSDVVDQLKTLNWNTYFSIVHSMGDQLNERQLRFTKSMVQDRAVAQISNGKIEYVDKVGQDHQLDNIRIETKCGKNFLTTPTGKPKQKRKTASIKLTNTQGSSDGRDLPNTFDYLMIVDTDTVAIASFQDIKSYVKSNGDGLSVQLPYEVLEWVVSPGELAKEKLNIIVCNIKADIDKVIDSFINEFDMKQYA